MPHNSEEVLRVFLHRSRQVMEMPTLKEKLTAIAEAIVEAELFRRVAVQLYRDQYGEKMFGWAGITEEEQTWLATHDTLGPQEYERVREYGTDLGNVFFVPHNRLYEMINDPDSFLLASNASWKGDGFWHPDDMLYAPVLASNGEPLGNVTADEPYDERVPTEATAALLSPFLALASLLVEQELDRRRDPLTTCFNGPFFRNEVRLLAEQNDLQGLLFLDMDNLKQANDQKGHAAGDLLIRETSQALMDLVRQVLGRYGQVCRLHGDEFVVIVRRGSPPMDALIETLRHERDLRAPNLSLGGASYNANVPLHELLAQAEQDMYQEKGMRKERTVLP